MERGNEMKISFEEMQEKIMPEFKGGTGSMAVKMYSDEAVKIMYNRLPAGSSVGLHIHEKNCEIVYILSGNGRALCDGVEELLGPGDCQYCAKGHSHTLLNDGPEDLIFFAVVPEQ